MDDELLERLLSTPVGTADEAPELARLLVAASTHPTQTGPLAGEEAALAAFRTGGTAAPSRRKRMLGKALAAKTLATLAAGTLTLGGGVAMAADATGVVPNDVGGAINNVVPFVNGHDNGKHLGQLKNQPGDDANNPDENENPGEHPDNHGADVSDVAHETDPGPGHGAAVSEEARTNHGAEVRDTKGVGEPEVDEHSEAQENAGDAQENAEDAQEKADEAREHAQEQSETEAPDTDDDSSGAPAGAHGGDSSNPNG